jgi:hypothetical protein
VRPARQRSVTSSGTADGQRFSPTHPPPDGSPAASDHGVDVSEREPPRRVERSREAALRTEASRSKVPYRLVRPQRDRAACGGPRSAACSEARNREPRSCTPIPGCQPPGVRRGSGTKPQVDASQGVEAPAPRFHRRARHRAGQEEVLDHEEDVADAGACPARSRHFGPRQPGSPQIGRTRDPPPAPSRSRGTSGRGSPASIAGEGETRVPEIPVLVAREDDERAVGRGRQAVAARAGLEARAAHPPSCGRRDMMSTGPHLAPAGRNGPAKAPGHSRRSCGRGALSRTPAGMRGP